MVTGPSSINLSYLAFSFTLLPRTILMKGESHWAVRFLCVFLYSVSSDLGASPLCFTSFILQILTVPFLCEVEQRSWRGNSRWVLSILSFRFLLGIVQYIYKTCFLFLMWWLTIFLPLHWYFRKIKFTLAFVYRFARLEVRV